MATLADEKAGRGPMPPDSLRLRPAVEPEAVLSMGDVEPAVPATNPRAPPAVGHLCGLWYWRPRWLQPLATIRVFIVCVCIFSCICSALNSGYVVSMISTIEKRFEIGSTLAGFMTSCYEIGYIPAVVLVSYLGGSRRKPVWLATGAFVMAIASLIFTLPQFIAPPYSATRLALGDQVRLCRAANHSAGAGTGGRLGADPCEGLKGGYGGHSNTFNVFLIVLANVLLGCGASPILTLGTTFIDDHTSAEAAPPLIATIYASAAVGPMVGHLVGAVMLQYYVDQYVYDYRKLDLSPGDPEWVGAWWGGFILFGLMLALCAVPLYMFPARLQRNLPSAPAHDYELPTLPAPPDPALPAPDDPCDEAAQPLRAAKTCEPGRPDPDGRDPAGQMTPGAESTAFGPGNEDYGKRWQDLPRSILLLIRNRVYLVTCTGICFEMAVINAFAVFLPKYIETQFSVANFTASVLTGSCAVPAGALGIIAGGLMCRRLGLNRRGAVRMVLLANIAVLILYFISFIIGCENSDIAGLNAGYDVNRSWSGDRAVQHSCNSGCGPDGGSCDELARNPVCSLDLGLTYLSPCHAGCTASNGSAAYTNCSCLIAAGLPPESLVRRGPCAQQMPGGTCASRKLVPFLIFLCLTIFVTALTQNPLLMVTMRSVRSEERAFALGFQFVIMRLFGYIPAPITFGRVIDSTCLHWLRLKQCPAAASSSAATSSAAAAAAAAAAMSAGIPAASSDAESSATGRLGGSCLFYNVVLFRNKVFGLALGLKFASLIVYVILWSLLKRDCLGSGESEEAMGIDLALGDTGAIQASAGLEAGAQRQARPGGDIGLGDGRDPDGQDEAAAKPLKA